MLINHFFYIVSVVALDRANAEDALRPIPKVFDSQEKSTLYQDLQVDRNDVMTQLVDSGSRLEGTNVKLNYFLQGLYIHMYVCMYNQLLDELYRRTRLQRD